MMTDEQIDFEIAAHFAEHRDGVTSLEELQGLLTTKMLEIVQSFRSSDVAAGIRLKAICNLLGVPVPDGWNDCLVDEGRFSLLAGVRRAIERVDNPDELPPPEFLASRLIDAWCDAHGGQITWAKAVEISAIITKMPEEECQRLLELGQ